MKGTLGEIRIFAGDYEPENWAFCTGRELPINEYEALFAILGATYGGNGRTTFCLPDFRDRAVVGAGRGPGLSSYNMGDQSGYERNKLTLKNIPEHSHTADSHRVQFSVAASADEANTVEPIDAWPAIPQGKELLYSTSADGVTYLMLKNNIKAEMQHLSSAEDKSFDFTPPYLCMNYIICVNGDYPKITRS